MKQRIVNEISRFRREEGSKTILAFAKVYLFKHLECGISQAHLAIYGLLQRILTNRGVKIALAAPRDFGKSTLITLIYILYCICYQKEKFIIIVSNTSSQACQVIDNIRRELLENQLLKSGFPELYDSNGKLSRSRESEIITHNGIKIIGLGSGQQVRGRRFGNARPGLVIADDLESAESIYLQETRQKTKDWFEKSLLKVGSQNTNYFFIGNLYHPYSLLGEYINKEISPGWEGYKYSAVITWPTSKLWEEWKLIRNGKKEYKGARGLEASRAFYNDYRKEMNDGAVLLWPERYDICKLMEEYENNPLSFMSEFQNTPIDSKTCVFPLEKFHYWTSIYRTVEELLRTLGENAEFFMACDPSAGDDSIIKNDYSAIAIIARDKTTHVMYLIECDIERRDPDKLLTDILAYCKRYKFVKVGFEANNFQGLLIPNLKKLLEDNHIYTEIVPIKNMANKTKRIMALLPYLKSGQLQLCKNMLLDEQLQFFPWAKHDDGPDALEMAVRLCEENQNGFDYWFAGKTTDPWLGRPLTPEEQKKRAALTPKDLVPWGWWGWHRMC